jgi:hypothetical protein
MDAMYRMLGREHEADLLSEAERLQRPVRLGLPVTPKGQLRSIVLRVFSVGRIEARSSLGRLSPL